MGRRGSYNTSYVLAFLNDHASKERARATAAVRYVYILDGVSFHCGVLLLLRILYSPAGQEGDERNLLNQYKWKTFSGQWKRFGCRWWAKRWLVQSDYLSCCPARAHTDCNVDEILQSDPLKFAFHSSPVCYDLIGAVLALWWKSLSGTELRFDRA